MHLISSQVLLQPSHGPPLGTGRALSFLTCSLGGWNPPCGPGMNVNIAVNGTASVLIPLLPATHFTITKCSNSCDIKHPARTCWGSWKNLSHSGLFREWPLEHRNFLVMNTAQQRQKRMYKKPRKATSTQELRDPGPVSLFQLSTLDITYDSTASYQ